MRGTYFLFDAPTDERSLQLTTQVESDFARFSRERTAHLEGVVCMDGIARERPLKGTVTFRVHYERRLRYEFRFIDDDGQRRAFRGQKDCNLLSPTDSLTLLQGSLYDENDVEVGRARLRLDLRGGAKELVSSVRLRVRRGDA